MLLCENSRNPHENRRQAIYEFIKQNTSVLVEVDRINETATIARKIMKSAIVEELINYIGYGSTEFFVLRCSEKILNRFVYYLVGGKIFRDKAKAVMSGSVG